MCKHLYLYFLSSLMMEHMDLTFGDSPRKEEGSCTNRETRQTHGILSPVTLWCCISWPAPLWLLHWGRGYWGVSKNIHSRFLWPVYWSYAFFVYDKNQKRIIVIISLNWRGICWLELYEKNRFLFLNILREWFITMILQLCSWHPPKHCWNHFKM